MNANIRILALVAALAGLAMPSVRAEEAPSVPTAAVTPVTLPEGTRAAGDPAPCAQTETKPAKRARAAAKAPKAIGAKAPRATKRKCGGKKAVSAKKGTAQGKKRAVKPSKAKVTRKTVG